MPQQITTPAQMDFYTTTDSGRINSSFNSEAKNADIKLSLHTVKRKLSKNQLKITYIRTGQKRRKK